MSVTLRQLAELVGGTVEGDGETVIQSAKPITSARPSDISFIESAQHAHLLNPCQASALVVPLSLPDPGVPVIRVADPLNAFIAIVRHLQHKAQAAAVGIDPRAVIHPSAKIGTGTNIHALAVIGENCVIGERCWIHPGVVIEANCRVGDDVVLYPNVVLYEGTILGARVIVHGNAVIGADGFGYRMVNGKHVKVPQLGHVEIGDDVEIGAGTTIDRGTFQATRVGEGTKIDNLVQVAHNCVIGNHNLIVSQVGLSGSVTTGNYVVLAGQSGVIDHIHIGDGAVVGGRAGVTKSVEPFQRVLGTPARPEMLSKKIYVTQDRLPSMRRDLEIIKRKLDLRLPETDLKEAG